MHTAVSAFGNPNVAKHSLPVPLVIENTFKVRSTEQLATKSAPHPALFEQHTSVTCNW